MVIWGLGGFGRVGAYVQIMMGMGILMMLIYGHLYFVPWQRFRRAVDAAEWPTAAKHIDQIRLLVTINLILGLITVVVGAAGRCRSLARQYSVVVTVKGRLLALLNVIALAGGVDEQGTNGARSVVVAGLPVESVVLASSLTNLSA